MIIKKINILDKSVRDCVICITTNGFVKSNGRAVMGRGIAASAKELYPLIDLRLGTHLKNRGNIVGAIFYDAPLNKLVMSFPVKPITTICLKDKSNVVKHQQIYFKEGSLVPGWSSIASISIILDSLRGLKFINHRFKKLLKLSNNPCVFIPKPGCGAGELNWDDVSKALEEEGIPENFIFTFI